VIPSSVEVIDSHTEGEPTRVILSGWPEAKGANIAERLEYLRANCADLRTATIAEPRGFDAFVSAVILPPDRPEAVCGVAFFHDGTWIGMCGHGTIGLVRTLHYLGRIDPGPVEIDTPVGPVSAELGTDMAVTIRNVPARVVLLDVTVDVPGLGQVTGDVVWGGNWFFLTRLDDQELVLHRRAELLRIAITIRTALEKNGITGDDGGTIDHVQLFGSPPSGSEADCKNFVLCPGTAYDRSPCGTGTSAMLAARHARGELALGQEWIQEGIVGTSFTGWITEENGELIPHIRGKAWITGRNSLLFDPDDPFAAGLR
jgi:4-hydroxyproline epimerase